MTYLTTNIFDNNLKLLKDTTPAIQNTFDHTTFVDISGSQITYLPSQDAAFVIYEYIYFQTNNSYPASNTLRFKLLQSSDGNSWTDYGGKTEVVIGRGNFYNHGFVSKVKFCLDATSWTALKYLKLQARHNSQYTTSGNYVNDVRLHQLRDAHTPSSAAGPYYYNSTVSCESVK